MQDVHEHSVPDFGMQDHSLWDEITGHKEQQAIKTTQNQDVESTEESKVEVDPGKVRSASLWWLIYDCIAKYPKFEQLKNFIKESHRIK